jgi:hypothetical protein
MPSALAADNGTPYLIQAEQYHRYAGSGLLRAIAQVESGGQFGYPWAWAINENGSRVFPAAMVRLPAIFDPLMVLSKRMLRWVACKSTRAITAIILRRPNGH